MNQTAAVTECGGPERGTEVRSIVPLTARRPNCRSQASGLSRPQKNATFRSLRVVVLPSIIASSSRGSVWSLPEDIVRFHTAVLVARAHNRYPKRVARHRDSPAETKTQNQTVVKLLEVVSLNHGGQNYNGEP